MKRSRSTHQPAWAAFALAITWLTVSVFAQPAAPASEFDLKVNRGAIVSLKRAGDTVNTEYIQSGRRLGDVFLRYRGKDGAWVSADTQQIASTDAASFSAGDGMRYEANYQVLYSVPASNTGSAASRAAPVPVFAIQIRYTVEDSAVTCKLRIQNISNVMREIDDLSIPLPISGSTPRGQNQPAITILKHSLISGNNSYMFWMLSNNVGPYLMLTPLENTGFEYWDLQRPTEATGGPAAGTGGRGTFRVFIHSAAAGAEAKAQGTKWRQPNTYLRLAAKGRAGDSVEYGYKLNWADNYDAVRQKLVDNGLIDVHVVPGMTVPSDLTARFALRSKQPVRSVEAEFPGDTRLEDLGQKGDMHFYQVRFARLGENRLTINFGNERHTYLEFFSTEPLETLYKKRAAFIARSQHRDPTKWYNGLITEWNMDSKVLLSPDNYDRIQSWRIYAVTCDDPGLGKPSYLAAKNAEYPDQGEVDALDYYIKNFVWGGLQQTTSEPYPYGIYGIPDWKTNRDSPDTGRNGQRHIWRIYDYPHIVLLYHSMYRVAKNFPQIKTQLSAAGYLRRAYGTADALFTIPMQVEGWSAYRTGLYNERVIVDVIRDLEREGLTTEAAALRKHWEQKVKTFVGGDLDLFRSEYAFDSTGFEATQALARYAYEHADKPGENNLGISIERARNFMDKQLASNIFCRGWLEPAYYYYGSDYRGGGGNSFTLSYMSQAGGWAVLDYALNYAQKPDWYLRLGYASYLSAWALMNTGTAGSNYGYWYPGRENDGGTGGGFEPAAYGQTWLNQPHHRGPWYYSSEADIGYSAAVRSATSVLADDPVFGRFCFGCDWKKTAAGLEIMPRDGIRRRFSALLGPSETDKLHMWLENDRFGSTAPITLAEDLSRLSFRVESDNRQKHTAILHISLPEGGSYIVRAGSRSIVTIDIQANTDALLRLPVLGSTSFVIEPAHR